MFYDVGVCEYKWLWIIWVEDLSIDMTMSSTIDFGRPNFFLKFSKNMGMVPRAPR